MSNRDYILSEILSERWHVPELMGVYVQTFEPGFKMEEPHKHNAVEVISVMHGSGYMVINDQLIRIRKNECLIIFPDITHRFFLGCKESCRIMNVHFHMSDISYFNDIPDLQEAIRFLYEIKTHTTSFFRLVDNNVIRDISKRIIMEVENSNQYSEALLKLYFCEMYIQLSKFLDESGDMLKKPLNEYLKRTFEYINNFYNEPITCDIIAENAGISSRHLSRIFNEWAGMSIVDYVTMLRMKKAKEMLKDTDMDITSIAHTTGFASSQYFTTCFKKYQNITPKEYRKFTRGWILNK